METSRAKEKVCPFITSAVTSFKNPTMEEIKETPANIKCIGPDCMAWKEEYWMKDDDTPCNEGSCKLIK